MAPAEVATRLIVAALAGAALGWERKSRRKPAGLRTHMIVTLGAACFMIAALQLHHDLVGASQAGNSDLMKVIGGIVGGIGFLGAGSIIRSGGEIHGLTTAANLWLASAIGVACGLGCYFLAGTAVLLGLTTLAFLGAVERLLPDSPTAERDHRADP